MVKTLARGIFLLMLFSPFLIIDWPVIAAAETISLSPGAPGPCTVTTTTVELTTGSVDIYVPDDSSCSDGSVAPYPAVVFAHGFSLFGSSDGRADNQGNGQHLASWGYVVGIPTLPDDFEERATVFIGILDFFETATADTNSFLYGKVDTARMGSSGYSLGGATALAAAARDPRVKAVLALDPVFHAGGFSGEEGDPVWDASSEAPNIQIPAGILGAPASSCNAGADFQDLYGLIGSKLKASFEIVNASHCVFADPGNAFCEFTCDGTIEPGMTGLSQKYMTSWLNFHLKGNPVYYSYLYGQDADEDISANLIVRQVDTFPTLVFIPWATR